MIRNQIGVSARSLLAVAVVGAFLLPPAGAGAREPSLDGWDEMARTASRARSTSPRISMSRTWTGSVHEEFRIDIRFTQSVTGFAIGDIQVIGATKVPPLTGSGLSYSLLFRTLPNHSGPVIVSIPSNVAQNAAREGNIGEALTFQADNKVPEIQEAKANGDEIVVVFDEALDENAVPPSGRFSVSFLRGGSFNVKTVSSVEVLARELFLTLGSPVDTSDVVRVFYQGSGANALRDLAGNLVSGFDREISNVTGEARTGRPAAPRDLTAVADGSTVIELEWDPPTADGGRSVTGYLIEVSADGGDAWSNLVRNTRSTRTSYRHTGLRGGVTRHYRVSAINFNGSGPASKVATATTEHTVPDAPRRLTARARGTSAIQLSWNAPASSGSASVTGYRIEVSRTGSGGWLTLEADTESTATAYTHDDLGPGVARHYRVAAINRAGRSAWSNVARAVTEITTPSAPTGLRVVPSGVGGSDQLLLTWSAPAEDGGSAITGYRIEISSTGVSGWIILVASTDNTTTAYLHTGLSPNTARFYRVAAVNGRGTGAFSNVARGVTNATRPGQPQNLRARGNGPNSILLTWDPPEILGGTPVTGYTIRARGPTDNSWIILRPNTGTVSTTFTHTGLRPVTRYQYQVAAINRVGAGHWSLTAATLTHADRAGAPTGLRARPAGTSRIDLSWTAPRYTGGVSVLGYRVEASDDEGLTWNIIRRNTNSAATAFPDLNLNPATTRHYRVAAINIAGPGPFSNIARATTEATLPGAPRSLAAQASGTSRIVLSWRAPTYDGGADVTGYRVEVSEDGGTVWQDLVADTRSTRTEYSHGELEPATTRHYRVSAINRIGAGEASRVASATTDATVPDAPTGLAATATTPTQIDLVWVAPAYDGGAPVTGYRVEVSEDGAAWADLVIDTESTGTAFSHTGLLPGSMRHYRVSAINRAGTGAASKTASAATDDPVQRAGRLNARVLPHVAAAMTSSTVSAIVRRVDAVANGMGTERRVEANGFSSMAASLSAPGAGGLGQSDGAALAALFGGTSFQMPFGAPEAPQQSAVGTRLASWGAGEYHRLGEPGASALDWKGDMVSLHAGVDARMGSDILAGLAGSYSSGAFDFTDKTGAAPVAGTYGATMFSVHPYLAWFSGERGNALWGSAGFGRGGIEVTDKREALRTGSTGMMTGAAGGSYQLFSSGMGGVRVKAEGWASRVVVDGTEKIDSVTLGMQRGKLALELTQGFRAGESHDVAFVLEGGMRYDNGDGMNGTGAELGGGVRYSNSAVGLTAEGRGRLVVSAREGYEEWGLGGMLLFDPAARGQGLSIRVTPSYGDHRSGVNQLWERGMTEATNGRAAGMGARVDGEVAYGIAGFHGMPYGGFHFAGDGVRAFSSGVRYELGAGVGLRLEGTRRESALGEAAHSVGVRGRIRLR